METLRIKKSTLYILGIIVLVVIGIYFVRGSFVGDNSSSVNGKISGNGAVQEITLGMKNGNYYPNTLNVEVNKPVRIYLDSSVRGCYRSFVIKSFGVSKNLANPSDYVEFTPNKEGTFGFACSMGMGTGKLVVGSGVGGDGGITGNVVSGGSCGMASGGSCGASGGCGCGG
jgi:plastocyanin domain-containing protein